MERDIVCILRLILDSFPNFIRNSKFLFLIINKFFRFPNSLFYFRSDYKKGKIKNLSFLYSETSKKVLKRISPKTDINSFHLKLIKHYFNKFKPNNYADIGCGSGFLINYLMNLNIANKILGIDFKKPKLDKNLKVKILKGDIKNTLIELDENSYDFVTCTHVIEHLEEARIVIQNLRRITSKIFIIICPMEKPHKWGFNYHINFFPNKKDFLDFVHADFIKKYNKALPNYHVHNRLGDIMYVEYF